MSVVNITSFPVLVLVSPFLKLNHYALLYRGPNNLPKFKVRVRAKINGVLHSKSYIASSSCNWANILYSYRARNLTP